MKKTGKQEMGWQRKVQGGFCMFLMMFGMSFCLESTLNIWIPWQARLIVSAFFAVFVEVLGLGIWYALSGCLVFVGALTVFCIRYQEILLVGLKQFSNRVLELVNAYYRTEYLLFYLDVEENYAFLIVLLILVTVGFLEGLILLATRNKKSHYLWGAILPVLLIFAGLMLGVRISSRGILLIFVALIVEIFDVRLRGNWGLCAAAIFIVACFSLLVSNKAVWERTQPLNEDWYQRQLRLEDRMLEVMEKVSDSPLFSHGELRQYTVENEAPTYTGEEVLRITVDYPISNPVYLRGFVGGTYENGKWQRISRQEFSDWAQSMESDEETCAGIIQSYPYELLETMVSQMMPIGKDKHVLLEMKQELRQYSLMPYFTNVSGDYNLRSDGIFPPEKETRFEWDSFVNLSNDEITRTEWIVRDPPIKIWDAYRGYVRQRYCKYPKAELEEMYAYVNENKPKTYMEVIGQIHDKLEATGNDSWEMHDMAEILTKEELMFMMVGSSELQYNKSKILELLWKDNRYSLDLEETPEGMDSVEYFLLEQHKGYCTHFASAATLLFRMNGIPARYVSGYLVMPSDFKNNEDGTWTAIVTDERAHAWTEIYYDNLGFCPVETTPPEYTELLENMEDEQDLTQALAQKDREYESLHPDETKKPEEEQETAGQQNKPESQEQTKDVNYSEVTRQDGSSFGILYQYRQVLVKIGLIIFAAVCICLFLWLRRRLRLQQRKQRFTQDNRTDAVCEIGKELGQVLALLGEKRKIGMDDEAYCTSLQEKLPEIDWEQAFLIFRKARFSEHGVTEEEYKTVYILYQNMEQKLLGEGGIRRWYLRWVKIYS